VDESAPKTREYINKVLLQFAKYPTPAHRVVRTKQLVNAQADVLKDELIWIGVMERLNKARVKVALLTKQCDIDKGKTQAEEQDAIDARVAGEQLLMREQQLAADKAQAREDGKQKKKARETAGTQAIASAAACLSSSASTPALISGALRALEAKLGVQPAHLLHGTASAAAASAATPPTRKRRRNQFLDDEAEEAGPEEDEEEEEKTREFNEEYEQVD